MKNKTMRVLAAFAIAGCALGAQAAVTVDLPELDNPVAGTLPGTPGVGADGSSDYDIDLAVPPGTAGMVPKLALDYSSKAPIELSGLGWSVGGLSQITRCPSTRTPDGTGRAVDLSAADQYCLDGQRLMLVSGTLGGTAEFRTQVKSFSRIKSYGGNPAVGPDYWTVETKSGLVQTYGDTGNSALVAPGYSSKLLWSIARSQDRHGNYVSYAYEDPSDGSGEHFISRIRYTGNDGKAAIVPYDAVDFVYETRPDPYTGYAHGALITR